MANRRMFSRSITSSDSFLSMSATAQNLYFHLGMEADDDGFAPFTKVSKMLGTSHDDMAQLLGRGFILQFQFGVYVIRDWKINNEIRADRYQATLYQKELAILKTNQSRQYYIDGNPTVLPNDNQMSPQVRLGKDRLDQVNEERETLSPQEKVFSSNKDITEIVLEEISQTYEVPLGFVKDCWDSATNWLMANGKTKKNYKAFLINWVKRERASLMLKARTGAKRGGVYDARE